MTHLKYVALYERLSHDDEQLGDRTVYPIRRKCLRRIPASMTSGTSGISRMTEYPAQVLTSRALWK